MTTNSKGQSLELFFIDGKPDGMLTAQVFNWTGCVLMTPRIQISEALIRKESAYTGVYLLIGETDKGKPLAYIGEGEEISSRIRSHDSKKDWWDTAVLITSTANNLNKAHAQYLESRLVKEAQEIGKITLENGNAPNLPGLSEAAQANMEVFFEYILMVLPALRIDFLLRSTRPPPNPQELSSEEVLVFKLTVPKKSIHAEARVENGEFIVQKDSLACKNKAEHSYKHLRDRLIKAGILREKGAHLIFKYNYAFKSPSAAATIVRGISSNGRKEWKVKGTNKTYGESENEKLQQDEAKQTG